MPDSLTPEYWHNRAEKVRTIADDMFDQKSRETLLRIAQNYEKMAKRAEDWLYQTDHNRAFADGPLG